MGSPSRSGKPSKPIKPKAAERGARLVQARKAKKLTQKKAAELLKLPDSRTLWRYESGQTKPPADVLGSMANLYAVSTEWLLNGGEAGGPVGRVLGAASGDDLDLTSLLEVGRKHGLNEEQRAALGAHLDELRRFTRVTMGDAERYAQRLAAALASLERAQPGARSPAMRSTRKR